MLDDKAYLGDGVYASIEHGGIMLRTPRADGEHYIFLEPEVLNNLLAFYKRARQKQIAESVK